jgi:hypothetical protein
MSCGIAANTTSVARFAPTMRGHRHRLSVGVQRRKAEGRDSNLGSGTVVPVRTTVQDRPIIATGGGGFGHRPRDGAAPLSLALVTADAGLLVFHDHREPAVQFQLDRHHPLS